MKIALAICAIVFSANLTAQTRADVYYKQIFEARYMDKPPIFPEGRDSLQSAYFKGFPAFDSLVSKCIVMGDTNKYIRIYFSFVVDNNGFCYDTDFYKIASTRSKISSNAKTIKYFFENKKFYKDAVKKMMYKMPMWKPGLQNGVPVSATVEDYLQIWIGPDKPVE